jgi:hypothetical protein
MSVLEYFRPNCALLTMMKDQFANYVVQKVRFHSEKVMHPNKHAIFVVYSDNFISKICFFY